MNVEVVLWVDIVGRIGVIAPGGLLRKCTGDLYYQLVGESGQWIHRPRCIYLFTIQEFLRHMRPRCLVVGVHGEREANVVSFAFVGSDERNQVLPIACRRLYLTHNLVIQEFENP